MVIDGAHSRTPREGRPVTMVPIAGKRAFRFGRTFVGLIRRPVCRVSETHKPLCWAGTAGAAEATVGEDFGAPVD